MRVARILAPRVKSGGEAERAETPSGGFAELGRRVGRATVPDMKTTPNSRSCYLSTGALPRCRL